MNKARLAAQARKRLDERLSQFNGIGGYEAPPRGWIKAIREALGMTTAQLARRLSISQPSITAIEQSETKGSIQLATLRRVAEALDCRLVYALVPRDTLEHAIRDKARVFATRRQAPVEHSMMLENQKVKGTDISARVDELVRETNPRLFWD